MRTATVTWITYHNYGTFLQAYALQQTIKKLGFSNAIIDDSRVVMPKGGPYDYMKRLNPIKRWYIYFNMLRHRNQWYQYIQNRKFEDFAKKYLTIDNDYKTFEELNDKYDVFIAGSDQIWFPNKEIFNPFFYLNFVTKKKISYAPSIGASSYPSCFMPRTKPLLEGFSHISVREQKGKDLLGAFLDKKIEIVLDPSLLLTSDQWNSIALETKYENNYAFLYLLTYNQTYINYVKQDSSRRGLKLITVANDMKLKSQVDKMIAAGPAEFVSFIKNASFIYTDSFHGTVFSILYSKSFITFKRFKDNSPINQNSRLQNLFSLTGIEGHFVTEDSLPRFVYPQQPIDYTSVYEKIDKKRRHSIKYLINAIEH